MAWDAKLLYEGKSKMVFETENTDVVLLLFKDDITAGDGEKKDSLVNKARLNQTVSKKIYEHLMELPQVVDEKGHAKKFYEVGRLNKIETHYMSSPTVDSQLVKKLDIVPVEVIIRNYAAGSFCKRYNIEKGHKFKTPLLELFYKDDSLNDPLCNDGVAVELGWAEAHVLAEMRRQAYILNYNMQKFWAQYDLILVDQKFEFGIDSDGNIMLADEITCDSQRLWDKDGNSLDKDVFRQGDNMKDVSDVYNYIHRLIGADPIADLVIAKKKE